MMVDSEKLVFICFGCKSTKKEWMRRYKERIFYSRRTMAAHDA
jgi:hypothetical protein